MVRYCSSLLYPRACVCFARACNSEKRAQHDTRTAFLASHVDAAASTGLALYSCCGVGEPVRVRACRMNDLFWRQWEQESLADEWLRAAPQADASHRWIALHGTDDAVGQDSSANLHRSSMTVAPTSLDEARQGRRDASTSHKPSFRVTPHSVRLSPEFRQVTPLSQPDAGWSGEFAAEGAVGCGGGSSDWGMNSLLHGWKEESLLQRSQVVCSCSCPEDSRHADDPKRAVWKGVRDE